MTRNQGEIETWSDADQQRVARAVAQQVRDFADSQRYGGSLQACDLSDYFRRDFLAAANNVLEKWWEAGAPYPCIQGLDVLSDGIPYRHEGEVFMQFIRRLVLPELTREGK